MARILLVDDDESYRRSMRRALKGCGHNVIEAENGKVAHDRLTAGDIYDVLVTDKDMPEMGGMALIHSPEAKEISLRIIISGKFEDVEKDGDIWKLPKPFEFATAEQLSTSQLVIKLIDGHDMAEFISSAKRPQK